LLTFKPDWPREKGRKTVSTWDLFFDRKAMKNVEVLSLMLLSSHHQRAQSLASIQPPESTS